MRVRSYRMAIGDRRHGNASTFAYIHDNYFAIIPHAGNGFSGNADIYFESRLQVIYYNMQFNFWWAFRTYIKNAHCIKYEAKQLKVLGAL